MVQLTISEANGQAIASNNHDLDLLVWQIYNSDILFQKTYPWF